MSSDNKTKLFSMLMFAPIFITALTWHFIDNPKIVFWMVMFSIMYMPVHMMIQFKNIGKEDFQMGLVFLGFALTFAIFIPYEYKSDVIPQSEMDVIAEYDACESRGLKAYVLLGVEKSDKRIKIESEEYLEYYHEGKLEFNRTVFWNIYGLKFNSLLEVK